MNSSPDPTSTGVLRGAAAEGAVSASFDTNLGKAGARVPRAPSVDAELAAAKDAAKAAGYAAGWAEGRRAAKVEAGLRSGIRDLQIEADNFRALLFAEPQILISWAAGDDHPQISGDTSLVAASDSQHQPQRVLAFGTWLPPEPALQMDHAVDKLREAGESFLLNLTSSNGRAFEAMGRAVGGQAIVRIRELSGLRHELAETHFRHQALRDCLSLFPGVIVCPHRASTRVQNQFPAIRAVEVMAHRCAPAPPNVTRFFVINLRTCSVPSGSRAHSARFFAIWSGAASSKWRVYLVSPRSPSLPDHCTSSLISALS